MTHIYELQPDDFTKVQDWQKPHLILKPKRTLSVNDTLILESNGQQISCIINAVTDRPGLMKGYVLIDLTKQ